MMRVDWALAVADRLGYGLLSLAARGLVSIVNRHFVHHAVHCQPLQERMRHVTPFRAAVQAAFSIAFQLDRAAIEAVDCGQWRRSAIEERIRDRGKSGTRDGFDGEVDSAESRSRAHLSNLDGGCRNQTRVCGRPARGGTQPRCRPVSTPGTNP